jgi:hypothetical protein
MVAMQRALSPPPPPHTRYSYKELLAPGQNKGGSDMAGPIFPSQDGRISTAQDGRISTAQVSCDLDFWILVLFL